MPEEVRADEVGRRLLDRPALDEPGGVVATGARVGRGEQATGPALRLGAEQGDLLVPRVRLRAVELSSPQPQELDDCATGS